MWLTTAHTDAIPICLNTVIPVDIKGQYSTHLCSSWKEQVYVRFVGDGDKYTTSYPQRPVAEYN